MTLLHAVKFKPEGNRQEVTQARTTTQRTGAASLEGDENDLDAANSLDLLQADLALIPRHRAVI